MKFIYETDRLYLKVLTPGYAEPVLQFLSDNKQLFEQYETAKQPSYYTLQHQADILQAEYNAFLALKYIRYYIFQKEEADKIIGTVSFSNILPKPYCSCTIGYKVDSRFHHMGYAREALTAAVEAMFKDFGIHRIEAYVLDTNIPSKMLLETLGFTNEGLCIKCIQIQNEYRNHYRYALISPFSI